MEPISSSSSNEGEHFFEGVEKLIEVWFTRKDGKANRSDLRAIPRSEWEKMLDLVKCTIISFTRNETLDAYVLSESSMFVSRRRFILKTCGSTTPLLCLKKLLQLVRKYTAFDEVQDLFYSRKNYKRPDLQIGPHRAFETEVELLDQMFPDGAAYCLGAVNRDCWYLYTLNPLAPRPGHSLSAIFNSDDSENDEDCGLSEGSTEYSDSNSDVTDSSDDSLEGRDDLVEQFRQRLSVRRSTAAMRAPAAGGKGWASAEPDQTLEIMMTDLDPEVMKIFTKEVSKTAAEATQKSRIDKILPNVVIDDYLFDPCGYSMNGTMKNGEYMTIHITPEPDFSYVSFESNIPQSSYMEVILRVLETFRPGKFIVTAFANKESEAEDTHKDLLKAAALGEFLRRDIQYCHLKNYDLTYALYSKFPS